MIQAVFILLWATAALAEKLIKTSALLPCQVSSEFSAKKFDVVLYPDERTVSLDVEISSAIDGNFTVEAELLVYGIKAYSRTFSGCDISKTICPISPGRFDVQTNISVPESALKEVPGIAYTFPNIDAVVQAKIYYVDASGQKKSNSPAGCVVAQLSNGKTVQHNYVSWVLFGIIIVGVVVSGFAALTGRSTTASHIISNAVSLFSYFQSTAIIGMMAVERMPPIAAAWVQNFEWTMGIISVGFMQTAITWYVRATGGSETTVLPNKDQISIAVYKKRAAAPLQAAETVSQALSKRYSLILNSNVTTTDEQDNKLLGKTLVLQGIKRVSFLANIEISNFFATGAAFFIFIGIAIVLIMAICKGVLELVLRKRGNQEEGIFTDYRANYRSYMKGTMFRYFLVGFTQLSLLCLWEFTNHASAATVVIACVMFAILLISLSIAATRVIALGRKSKTLFNNPASILFGNAEVLNRWGFLYVQYKASSYYFVIIALIYNFAKSAVIALGQASGKVQSIVFVVIEIVYFIVLCVVRPYMNKKTNGYNIAISVFSIVNAIFYMFFSRLFGDKVDVGAAIIGIVYFIMNAVLSAVFLILIVVACIMAIFHPNPDTRYQPVTDDRNMFIPDTLNEKEGTELDDLGNTARDGYRHSYLHYDPAAGAQSFGASRNPDHEYYDENAPQNAFQRHTHTSEEPDETIPSFRDVQSRGVLADRREPYYPPDERLI